jgi:hypothetical protein
LTFVKEPGTLPPYLLAAVHECVFLVAIYSLTFCWSSVSRRPLLIATGMLFMTILQFALYLVERVTQWSLIRLVDIEVLLKIQAQRALDVSIVLPLIAFSAVCLAVSQIAFARRVP